MESTKENVLELRVFALHGAFPGTHTSMGRRGVLKEFNELGFLTSIFEIHLRQN
jgi:hypothetical protein